MPIIIYAIFDEEIDKNVLTENKINYYKKGIKRNRTHPCRPG